MIQDDSARRLATRELQDSGSFCANVYRYIYIVYTHVAYNTHAAAAAQLDATRRRGPSRGRRNGGRHEIQSESQHSSADIGIDGLLQQRERE